jgi:hypothetical protein
MVAFAHWMLNDCQIFIKPEVIEFAADRAVITAAL